MFAASSFAPYESRNGALRDAVLSRNFALGSPVIVQSDDRFNDSVCQCASEWHDARDGGVQVVVKPRNPFEIGNDVVGLIEVNVVDLTQILGIWNEGERDQSVNRNSSRDAFSSPKLDAEIPTSVKVRLHNTTGHGNGRVCFSSSRSVSSSNASEVTDFVKSIEDSNGDGSPFFDNGGTHAAGHPSELAGLEIKNPSRAQTRGGFAIDSTLPPAIQATGGIKCL